MNYVESSKFGHAEEEFLWAPYSVFTVENSAAADPPQPPTLMLDSDRAKKGSYLNPQVLTLHASIDNRLEAEDLPLAPWY